MESRRHVRPVLGAAHTPPWSGRQTMSSTHNVPTGAGPPAFGVGGQGLGLSVWGKKTAKIL